MPIRDYMEKARRAQQENEQKHDVQLEISGAFDLDEVTEILTGFGAMNSDNHSKSEKV